MKYPTFVEEKKLWKRGFEIVVGLDEAGRGPLAGPVVAAAVMINPKFEYRNKNTRTKQYQNLKSKTSKRVSDFVLRASDLKLRDSKKLSAKQRKYFYEILIKHKGLEWGIGVVSEKMIDKINIKNAAELAMQKALENLEKRIGKKADFLLIDGNHIKNHKLKTLNHKLIVAADEKVFSCAAASILAKVRRDRLMKLCHKKYPKYRFDLHKGYPTELHRRKLRIFGPCVIHRRTFLTKICVVK